MACSINIDMTECIVNYDPCANIQNTLKNVGFVKKCWICGKYWICWENCRISEKLGLNLDQRA